MEVGAPTFEYLQRTDTNKDIKGIFAFSFYFPASTLADPRWGTKEELEKSPYLQGLRLYIESLTRSDSVFKDWKLLLYTDRLTYDAFLQHKLFEGVSVVEYAIVSWPSYSSTNGKVIAGDVLRVMRFRAFFDFPTVPVFVRDADTLFAITDYESYVKKITTDNDLVYKWEKSYLEGAMQYENTLIFGTSLYYKRHWHVNKVGSTHIPLGAFAGLISAIPKVPCFQGESLWKRMMEYIDKAEKGDVGKDEQILSLLVLPACIDNTFFFELDMHGDRKFVLKREHYSPNYPKAIFKRGSNTNLKNLFQSKANKKAVEQMIETIQTKNKQKEEDFEQEIQAMLNAMNTVDAKFRDKKKPVNLYASTTGIPRAVHGLRKSLKNDDLERLLEDYNTKHTEYFKERMQFINSLKRNGLEANIEGKKTTFKEVSDKRDAALRAILAKVLEMKKNETSLSYEFRNAIPTVQRLLEYQKTGVVPELPVPVPVVRTPSAFSGFTFGLPTKKGGRTHKLKRKSKQSMRRKTRKT